jgi:DNA repair protein RAD51/nuclear pore complex protein Nup160
VDQDIKSKWRSFYGIVRDLYKRQTDAVSFVVDPHDQIPWLVAADCVAPIRECSQLEKIGANAEIVHALPTPKLALYSTDQADDESRSEAVETDDGPLSGNLFFVSHTLRSLLPVSFQETFKRVIKEDLIQEPSSSVADRLHGMQNATSLLEQLSEEDNVRFDDVVTEFGGYQVFHTDNFIELLKKLTEPEKGRHQEEQITRFGAKMVIRISQETVALNMEVLLDLLATVLYLEGSFEIEELVAAIKGLPEDTVDAMEVDNDSPAFDASLLFEKVMSLLHENILLDFLTSNMRKERSKLRRRSVGESPVARSIPEPVYASTLLQSVFIGDWSDVRAPEEGISPVGMLTYITRAWLTKLEVNQYENFSAHVFADLVKHGDLSLAEQFMPFVPITGWSSYLRGRLSLESGDYDKAADWFTKAAFAMCECFKNPFSLSVGLLNLALGFFDVNNQDTAELLRPDQVEKFSDGLPAYYEHIMDLLDKFPANSHKADFAKLALQAHNMNIKKAHEVRSLHCGLNCC